LAGREKEIRTRNTDTKASKWYSFFWPADTKRLIGTDIRFIFAYGLKYQGCMNADEDFGFKIRDEIGIMRAGTIDFVGLP